MSPDNIATFQSLLLEILDTEQDAIAIRTRLDADIALTQLANCARDREFVKYIETFDPVMLEIAAKLVKKWGRN